VDLSRLRPGDLLAAVGAVALLVVMFLDWYSLEGAVGVRSIGLTAWQAFGLTDVILAIAALAAIGLAVLTAARRSPALPVAASVVSATLGVVAVVLVFYRILNQPGPNEFVEVKLGAFLGFLAAVALAVGAWRSMRDEEWPGAPVETDARPAPPPEGQPDAAPPPEAEPRA